MTYKEASELTAYMGKLFNKWNPTQEQIEAWENKFIRYEDISRVKDAILELFQSTSFNEPKIEKFSLAMQRSSDPQAESQGPVDTKLFIQCVVAPPEHLGMAGWFIPLVFAMKKAPPEEYWRDRAEQVRDNYANMYGGEWQFVDCSYEANPNMAMCKRRVELSGRTLTPAEQ